MGTWLRKLQGHNRTGCGVDLSIPRLKNTPHALPVSCRITQHSHLVAMLDDSGSWRAQV